MVKLYRKINRWIPLPAFIAYLFALAALVIQIISINSTKFSDAFNSTVSSFFRTLMAKITSFTPTSLAELVILSSPLIITAAVVVSMSKADRGKRYFIRVLIGLGAVVAFVYAMFTVNFGVGYRTTSLDKRIGLKREKVTANELYDTMCDVVNHLNELSDDIIYASGTGSVRPYSHNKAVELCRQSYKALSEKYDFISVLDAPVKQIVLSEYMTYTHISGMYTFYTGEANLNTNYPYFVSVYTTAHEMAHQRGIARENEANFIAYLVCITSDDPYMQYSGYLNMYEYLASPLYSASPSLYGKAIADLDLNVRYDLHCYSEFFEKYRDNVAADVSDAVNDTYLVLQGTEGAVSYGMVVDLAVAYYKENCNAE